MKTKKWKCPKCKRLGFPSIHYPVCTDCANQIRYEKHELSSQYYPRETEEKKWYQFWK